MKLRLWIALGAACATVVVLAASAQASFPGQNGKIAYRDSAFAGDIWTIEPDGTGATNVTKSAANEDTPSWSADGAKIAFSTDVDKTEPCSLLAYHAPLCNAEIYIMNPDGTGQTRVTHDSGQEHNPSFSPDGSKLAVTDFTGCFSDVDICFEYVDVIDLSGGFQPFETGLGNDFWGGFTETGPAWSPDGAQIAFVHLDDNFTDQVYVSGVDGSNPQLVVPGQSADWSPDQSKLLISTLGRIAEVRPDGSGLAHVTEPPAGSFDGCGVWSPDGTKIAFTRFTTGSGIPTTAEMYVANADGSAPVKIGDGCVSSWQPLSGPRRSDYKNTAKFCKADRDFLGDGGFASKYGSSGNGADAFGKCVAGKG
jgi:Tol biopolymer transport system component